MYYKVETQCIENGGAWEFHWTTETPTKPGVYWAMRKGEREPEIVRRSQVDINTGVGYCWAMKADSLSRIEFFTHWMGPLPPPEAPK